MWREGGRHRPSRAEREAVRRLTATVLVIAALAAGCSSGGSSNGSVEELKAGNAALEARNAELEARVGKLEGGNAEFAKSVDALEEWAIKFQSAQLKRRRGELKAIADLREDLDALVEALGGEEQTTSLADIAKELKAIQRELDKVASTAETALAEAEEALAAVGALPPPETP